MTKEQEIVRSVFDAYIRDAKATSTKKDRPTFDMLEKVKNRAIKALEQQPSDDCVNIAELEKWLDSNFSFGGACRKLELFDRLEKELPRVTPTQSWIPVSEKLPESEGLYLVSVKNDRLRQYSKTCWFNSHLNWFSRQDVTAWQPLPQPYEEKRGNLNGSN